MGADPAKLTISNDDPLVSDNKGGWMYNGDTGEFIIDASDAEIAAAKPGDGPNTGWETETGMDVNMDGVVDRTDLDLATGTLPDGDGDDGTGEDDSYLN